MLRLSECHSASCMQPAVLPNCMLPNAQGWLPIDAAGLSLRTICSICDQGHAQFRSNRQDFLPACSRLSVSQQTLSLSGGLENVENDQECSMPASKACIQLHMQPCTSARNLRTYTASLHSVGLQKGNLVLVHPYFFLGSLAGRHPDSCSGVL